MRDPCTIALEADKQLMALLMQPASPTEADRFQLVENYVDHIIDGMDTDSLVHMVRDLLMNEYDKLTWDEVTDEIVDLYDEDTLIDLLPDANWYKLVSRPTSWQGGTPATPKRPTLCL